MIYAHFMTMVNTNINILELSFVFPTWSLILWKYYLRENLGVFCMPYLVPGLMEILLEGRPWRICMPYLVPGLMEILHER